MEELKYLNLKRTGEAEVPEGLEERLSMKIDLWAEEEKKAKSALRANTKVPYVSFLARFRPYRNIAVAACISLIIGIGSLMGILGQGNNAHKDTFDNPELARIEAEKALYLLAYNMEKGTRHLKQAKDIVAHTETSLNNTLKQLK
jgi:ElaB/YqjD/DUF883 family membrane-anchored ribosome-binding protein